MNYDPRQIADEMGRVTRRQFLGRTSLGLGMAALASGSLGLQSTSAAAASMPGNSLPPMPHFAPQAKRVIFLCMAGGPSHLETFDSKPALQKLSGKPMPESFTKGQPIAQLQGKPLTCMGPQTRFHKYGQSGLEISDYLPHIASIADEITVIRSMVTEQINHDPAHTFLNCGSILPGMPSMGAWVTYGLGSVNENLPSFVVLTSKSSQGVQPIANRQWNAGFLPGRCQGVEFQGKGAPIHYVSNPNGVSRVAQEHVLSAITEINRLREAKVHDPELETRIEQYELAFRMQMSVPELMDFSDETPNTLAEYGAKPGDGSFASNCLLARRLAERGVRFIHLYHRGWDFHGGLASGMKESSGKTDRPTAALILDLKRRGLLDDTLVIWGGEFGRTPMAQGNGRDHHIKGYSMFLAGGGIKQGLVYGATDELGYNAVDNVVNVRDLHATMLHQLGIDHSRLSVRIRGLDMKLTGVKPSRVVKEIVV
ncbi:MAG: DUF1501 domain-containing protein [Planctomycetes bacterium]|nr:DUF1501 domain-containing protein [Planctomycetota bacterium]